MKKQYIIGVLFFSGLWGLSEAFLGGALYGNQVPFASVPLTIIAFGILTLSRIYFPQKGTATLIALCAMLYKFFNAPFFVCHLLGIAMIGICYDICFAVFESKNKPLSAFTAALLNYALFAFMMTYITNNGYWNTSKLFGHIGEGTIAALCCAVIVPAVFKVGQSIKTKLDRPFSLKWEPAPGSVSLSTIALWSFSLYIFFNNITAG